MTNIMRRLMLILGGILVFGLAYGVNAGPDDQTGPVFSVTLYADGNDGACTNLHCTLREAIIAANAYIGANPSVKLTISGTYNLSLTGANEDASLTGDLDVTRAMSISGTGINDTIIDGNSIDRIFDIHHAQFSMQNLSLREGNADYGAALRWDVATSTTNFTLSNLAIFSNSSQQGGAVYLHTSAINEAYPVSLSNLNFHHNSSSADGAAIYADTLELNLDDSSFSNNTATGDGGAVFFNNVSGLSSNNIFQSNSAANGGAVAIENSDNIGLSYSRFSYNTASSYGGAIYFGLNGGAGIEHSELDHNSAAYGGAAAIGAGGTGGTFAWSSLVYNTATDGGALWLGDYSLFILGQNTIAMNSATNTGGAIHLGNGTIMAGANTIVDNSAATGGGIYATETGFVSMGMVLLANNSGGDCYLTNPIEPFGLISSNGYNWVEDIGNCFQDGGSFPTTGDVTGQNPSLSAITQVDDLRWVYYPAGALLEAVPASECSNLAQGDDMLGNARPLGSACEIGAIELNTSFVAPSGLSATFSNNQVQLSWTDNASDESSYRIERSSDSGISWTEIAQLAANTVTYNNVSLSCGTTYQYRVRAYRVADDTYSDYSNIAIPDSAQCSSTSIENLQVIDITEETVTLRWYYYPDPQLARSFHIEYRAVGDWLKQSKYSSSPDPIATEVIRQLYCDTDYEFTVSLGQYTASVTARTSPCTHVDLPATSSLAVAVARTSNVTFTYTAPSGYSTNSQLIYYSPDDGTNWFLGYSPRYTNDRTIYGLLCGTNYLARVRTVAFVGLEVHVSPLSEPLSFYADCELEAPANLQAFVNPLSITLDWTRPNQGETHIIIERSDDGVSWNEIDIVASSLYTPIFSDSTSAETCENLIYYRLRSYDSYNDLYSPYSDAIQVENHECAPAVPTNFAVIADYTSLNFSWQDNADNEDYYIIEKSADGSSWRLETYLAPNATSYAISNLNCSTGGYYRVVASNGRRSVSEAVHAITLACDINPPTLFDDHWPDVSTDTVPLQWTDRSNNETDFLFERSADNGLTWQEVAQTAANTTFYYDDPLICNATYQYRVRAYNTNTGQYSPYSNVITATTDPCIEPPASSICTLNRLDLDAQIWMPFTFLSGDGSRVAVATYAPSVGQDSYELLLFDTSTGALLATIPQTTPLLDISDDGKKVVFFSRSNYTGGNADGNLELFLWNDGAYTQITNSTFDVADSEVFPQISGNGMTVSFAYLANLITNTNSPNAYYQYVWRQATGLKLLVDTPLTSVAVESAVTEDGNTVIFSHSGNLTNQDLNHEGMLYRKNLTTNAITGIGSPSDNVGFIRINADGSRMVGQSAAVTADNPDGNTELFSWSAATGWQQLTYTTDNNDLIFAWMDDTGKRILFESDFDVTGENPYIDDGYHRGEYFIYDAGVGFSQLSNHNTAANFGYGDALSDDGTRAALLLKTANHEQVTTVIEEAYWRIFIADCPLPSASVAAPSNLQAQDNGTGGVNLTWTDNSDNESAFVIEWSNNGGSTWSTLANRPANTGSYAYSGLTCNVAYSYRLRAYNATYNSYSTYSNTASVTLPCFVAAPSNLQLSQVTANQTRVSWTDNSWNESSFRIESSLDGTNWSELTTSAAGTSQVDVTTSCGAEYYFRLRAYSETIPLYSDYTAAASILIPLCSPTSFAATPSQFSIALAWSGNNSKETGFELQRRVNGGTWANLASLPVDSSSYNDNNLECQTSYDYRLRALSDNTALNSAWVNLNTTTSTCPPLVPSTFSTTATTATSISLDWTVDTTATSFTLWVSSGGSWTNLGSFNRSSHSYTHGGLACGSSRQYRMQTFRQQDNATVYSEVFTAASAACAPLAAPAAPVLVNADVAIISLQIPAKPTGASSLQLERSTDGTNWQALGTATGYYLDSTVACASTYQYRLLAVRGAESSPASPSVSATTDACPAPILASIGLYKDGRWLFNDTTGNPAQINFGSGTGWQALAGDWDGDGADGIGLYKDGVFILRNQMNGNDESRLNFGNGTGWQALVGDWDGDGIDSIGLYKNQLFILSNDNVNEVYRFNFGGGTGWQAVAGDWDGNGADSVGLYKNGFWQLTDSLTDPQVTHSFSFGPEAPNWLAVAGDWDGNGTDGVGLYANGAWRLRETANEGASERALLFGEQSAGWLPLASSPYVPTTPPETIPVLADDDDSDGLSNGDENFIHGTDPQIADTDGDGLGDGEEFLIHDTNPLLADTDADGLSDGDEINTHSTDPLDADSDNDGLSDGDEINTHGTNPLDADSDDDTLSDGAEVNTYNTNPLNTNTDGDDMDDSAEALSSCRDANDASDNGTICPNVDTDSDGIPDVEEMGGFLFTTNVNLNDTSTTIFTDRLEADTDGDGLNDGDERYVYLTFADEIDSDGDSLSDGDELNLYSTLPLRNDSDGDSLRDDNELNLYQSNPLSTNSDGDTCIGVDNNSYSLNDQYEVLGVLAVGHEDADSDGIYNLMELDSDNDNLGDCQEVYYFGTNPYNANTDGDELNDAQELMLVCRDPNNPADNGETCGTESDTDADGLTDYQEVGGFNFVTVINGLAVNMVLYTDPLEPDTDGDGLNDYQEYSLYGTYPTNLDSDGDGLTDGGEQNDYGSNPRSNDTDSDGLSDSVEYNGISNYSMTIDGVTVVVNLPGQSAGTNPKFSMINTDTDSDGWTDGDEVNIYHTNPLDADTDNDAVLDSVDPLPLNTGTELDTDGDGISDADENAAIPPTNYLLFDSDGDGMGDGDEFITNFTSSATGYNLATNATYTISYNNETFQLETTAQDADSDGLADGYDSDDDGLSDTFELYWYMAENSIRAIHPQFRSSGAGTFSGSMETCGYSLSGNQPLHPNDADTDDDGLFDGYECNVYNTNPFSAANEAPIFDKVTDSTFLNAVVYPAINGDLELAAASARALGYTVSSDGLISVAIVRSIDPAAPTKRLLMDTLITSSCGASAYTNASGVTTQFANVCGVYATGTEPSRNNDDLTSPVIVRIPLSQFFTILRDSRVQSMSPQ